MLVSFCSTVLQWTSVAANSQKINVDSIVVCLLYIRAIGPILVDFLLILRFYIRIRPCNSAFSVLA